MIVADGATFAFADPELSRSDDPDLPYFATGDSRLMEIVSTAARAFDTKTLQLATRGELRSQLEEDYGEMITASMFVRPPPTFETIAARLAELEGRINDHLKTTPVRL